MHKNKVAAVAFQNPVFVSDDGRANKDDQQARTSAPQLAHKEHASVHVQPVKNDDLVKLMYPNGHKLIRALQWKYFAVNILIIGHIILTGYTDPMTDNSNLLQILMVSLQICLLIAVMMAFFVLTSQTLFVQLGRYDKVVKEFKLLYITFAVELILMLAVKAMYVMLILQHTPHMSLWRNGIYSGLWMVQRVLLVVFWVVAAYSSNKAFDERYYDPEYVFDT